MYNSIHYSNLLLNECQHMRFTYKSQLTITRRIGVHLERAGIIFRIFHCVCVCVCACMCVKQL